LMSLFPTWKSCGHRVVPAPNVTLPKGKIVGGSRAKPGAWPWLVSVLLNGELMCSGVLVGSAWIVTAAHCFTGSRNELAWSVVLGDYDLTKWDEGEQVVSISRILPHPKFDPNTFHADVALLELSAPVRPSAWVAPVCLPERAVEVSQEVLCYIVGWGSLYEDGPPAEVVMEARVPILAPDLCRGALGSQLVSGAMFCAGYLSGGIDSCQGDSGGPLMCWDPSLERYVLYGITSWGSGCGERGKPGVYTRILAFADWIRQQMERSPSSREPSCSEWLAAVRKPRDKQLAEVRHLCAFYAQPCAWSSSPAACAQAAEEKCKGKRQQCGNFFFLNYQPPALSLLHLFPQILVDLASKNAKGLYRAHIQAIVAQKATRFSGLVGLEQDSLYRSMPEIIALGMFCQGNKVDSEGHLAAGRGRA
uniref:Serine protease 56 n=1 Tax=Pseudonaja textilis TaxID=8673 RepID=A0A670ZH79_PSETE